MNLSIIIPNYNGEKLLRKNLPKVLQAVEEYKNGTVEIIISDDGSTDDSKEVISNFIEKLKAKNIIGLTIENKNNNEAGFSKNINRAVKLVTGEIIILLNSDVAPHEDFLDPLLRHFDDPEVFAVGCMDESHENGKVVLRGRGIGSFKRGFLMHRPGSLDKSSTLWVSGGSSAFRKSIWDKLSGLDPLYNPFYWEDIDLSYRALKSGYKAIFEPKSIVIHSHEEGVIRKKFDRNFVKKIAYRNQFIFVWKNITDKYLLISHFLWLPYHLAKAVLSADRAFINGFLLALIKIIPILNSRKLVLKFFVKKDLAVLENFKI